MFMWMILVLGDLNGDHFGILRATDAGDLRLPEVAELDDPLAEVAGEFHGFCFFLVRFLCAGPPRSSHTAPFTISG